MAYRINAPTRAHEPNTTVYYRPTLSDQTPVGTSKIAEDNIIIPKILAPNVYEPDILEK
jgi:hypothetical protein